MTVQQLIGSRSDVFSVRDEMTVHDAARYLPRADMLEQFVFERPSV